MMLLVLSSSTGLFFFINYQIEKEILINQVPHRARVISLAVERDLARLISKGRDGDLSTFSDDERGEIRKFIAHFQEEQTVPGIHGEYIGAHDLYLIDTRNRIIIDDPPQREGQLLPPEERIDATTLATLKANEIDTRTEQHGRDTILFMTFPLFPQQQLVGFARIEMRMNHERALLGQIRLWGLIAAAGLFLVGSAFAAYLAKHVTRPIGELAQAAERIGRGDLTVRMDESRRDEIGVLMTAFNRMVDDILKLDETQKRIKTLELESQIAPRLAHEIKNPLNSIGLIIDHLRDQFAPVSASQREKFLELAGNVKGEVHRLHETVERFLRSSTPVTLSRQPTDLNDLVDKMIALISPEARQQGVKVHRRFDRSLPRLAVDAHQLGQALLNLLTNALHAMPDGGDLVLSTSASEPGRETLAISVQDTGIGIPPANLPRLFDPYFTTKQRGFGLGLPIVERIVKEHGGRVEVASVPGKGSTFTVWLPVHPETDHAVP